MEQFIKEWLLTNQFRVYAVIAETYYEKLNSLKPFLFRKWLATQLSIDEEKINISSLGSALARQRNKMKKQAGHKIISTDQTPTQGQRRPYQFSKDDEPPQKESIVEL